MQRVAFLDCLTYELNICVWITRNPTNTGLIKLGAFFPNITESKEAGSPEIEWLHNALRDPGSSSLHYAIMLCASFTQVYKKAAAPLAIVTVFWVEAAKKAKGQKVKIK